MLKKFNYRKLILILADAFVIVTGCIFTNMILYFFDFVRGAQPYTLAIKNISRLSFVAGVSAVVCFFTLYVCGAYSKMWRYFNRRDYIICVAGVAAGVSIATLICWMSGHDSNHAFAVLSVLVCSGGIALFRLLFRTTFLNLTEAGRSENYRRTLIVGAGQAARLIIKEIENSRNDEIDSKAKNLLPVCLVDDDPTKFNSRLSGIEVIGNTDDIPRICKESNISLIIFAIPSCDEADRKRILDICSKTHCNIKIIPYLSQLLFEDDKTTLLNQAKDINIEDLLGREPITFDKNQISEFINGKICMVTGGGGSIGSELVRQIAKYDPKQIIIVDIYENNAYDIQQELLIEYGNTLNLETLIASVRDYDKMETLFAKYKPDIVFHAAAHKHVPLMEVSPAEAVKNNIFGTLNVAQLAEKYGVKKFVMISTDKAVNPTNVMGATKRCCEMIVQYKSQNKKGCTEFVTTRFGNVLGSNGSVIPLFRRQIESGKPVTVTHPDIIRYFMTIPEAVSLVLQAGAMAHGGEIFVLDMGEPVKITTLAENLIRMYGKIPYKDVEIKFTGLRPGEKLFEELLMDEEGLKSTANKKIFIGNQIKINEKEFTEQLSLLKSAAAQNDSQKTVELLQKTVPTFNHRTNS